MFSFFIKEILSLKINQGLNQETPALINFCQLVVIQIKHLMMAGK